MKKLFLVGVALSFMSFSHTPSAQQHLCAPTPSNKQENLAVSNLGLYNEILEMGIEFPDIVWAQAILESGHFTSRVFKENNNLFGMRLPKSRSTLAKGSRYGYAIFEYWQESVGDYWLYQEALFRKKGKMTRTQYLSHLNRSYASTRDYSKLLAKVMKGHKSVLYEVPAQYHDGEFNEIQL
jgi:hypothetical protein